VRFLKFFCRARLNHNVNRTHIEDNVNRKSASHSSLFRHFSCPFCFDYGVYSEMIINLRMIKTRIFLRCFRDPIRVPRIRENDLRVPRIRENRVSTGACWAPNIFLKKKLMKAMKINPFQQYVAAILAPPRKLFVPPSSRTQVLN